MSNMPRLHPDDLEAFIEGVSQRVGKQVVDSLEKLVTATNQTYTIQQVAKLLNCDTTTIYNHINRKLLTASKVGKSWKVTQAQLDDYLKNKN